MSEIDALTQQIAELQNTIREHRGDTATLDMDYIKAQFAVMVEKLGALQAPQRRGATEDIGPMGARRNRVVQEGKYAGYDMLDLYLVRRSLELGKKPISDELKKAMDSTTDGAGDDWVPTLMAGELWEQFYLQSKIAQALGPAIPMPSNPYHIPIWSTFTWYKGAENTATTASNPTTAQSILTATELLAEVNWSYTLDEDSIVPMMPSLRAELVRSGAEKLDAFLLNADGTDAATGNINLDDADPAATSYYLSAGQDGIRHYWLVDDATQGVDAGGDALGEGDILGGMRKMGKYAVNPAECVMITDAATYLKGLLNLDTVITLDKCGPQATVLTGQLAAYRGIPIVVSESAPLTEADGKVSDTAGNNTLGQISIANRRMWKVGTWRSLLVEVDRDIQKRQTIMVASFRTGIAAYDRTSDHAAGIYNILV